MYTITSTRHGARVVHSSLANVNDLEIRDIQTDNFVIFSFSWRPPSPSRWTLHFLGVGRVITVIAARLMMMDKFALDTGHKPAH